MTTWERFIGNTFGPYQIERAIASGMYGHVFRATHSKTRGTVALKVLKEEWWRDPMVRSRFRAEATAAAMIGHSNIVSVYDISDSDAEVLYIVMEYLEGKTLGKYLDGNFSTHRALNACYQAARALSAAHAKGVVHRDVKPDNIMLIDDGRILRVKVLDFGIAAVEAELIGEADGGVVGSPLYMSPEAWRNTEITAKSDVYSLGLILYETLARRRPFSGSNEELKALHTGERPPALPAEVSRPLAALVSSSLEKRPANRPDMLEVKRVLSDHLEREPSGSIELLAREWASIGRPDSHLLEGRVLDRALRDLPERKVGDIATEFLLASSTSKQKAEQERAESEKRRLGQLVHRIRKGRRNATVLLVAFAATSIFAIAQCRANSANQELFRTATEEANAAKKRAIEAEQRAREADDTARRAAADAAAMDAKAREAETAATKAEQTAGKLKIDARKAFASAKSDQTKAKEAASAAELARIAKEDAEEKKRLAEEAQRLAVAAQSRSNIQMWVAEGSRSEAQRARREAETTLAGKTAELERARLQFESEKKGLLEKLATKISELQVCSQAKASFETRATACEAVAAETSKDEAAGRHVEVKEAVTQDPKQNDKPPQDREGLTRGAAGSSTESPSNGSAGRSDRSAQQPGNSVVIPDGF